MKKEKNLKIIIVSVVLIILLLAIMFFFFLKNDSKLDQYPFSYSFTIDMQSATTKAKYEANVDINRHDLHYGDMNYLESKTKYYRFNEEEQLIKYFTYDCSGIYKDDVCVLKWTNYVQNYPSKEDVRKRDVTRLYEELFYLYNQKTKDNVVMSFQEMESIMDYVLFIDDTFQFTSPNDLNITFSKDKKYLKKVVIENASLPEERIEFEFKNFNKFYTVEQLYEIDSRM